MLLVFQALMGLMWDAVTYMYMYIYKILKPPFPVLKAGHPVCNFHCYSIFIWTYNLMSVCVCMWFSKPLRMPVGVCVYIQ